MQNSFKDSMKKSVNHSAVLIARETIAENTQKITVHIDDDFFFKPGQYV